MPGPPLPAKARPAQTEAGQEPAQPRDAEAARAEEGTQAARAVDPRQARVGTLSRLITSRELMGLSNEIFIEHHGEIYRLRETRSGKLILNK